MTSAPDFEETRAAPRSADDEALPRGTRLREYEIVAPIAAGPYSLLYLGFDRSLQRQVAVKEYFPESIAARAEDAPDVVTPDRYVDTFKAGLASFVEEARLLARFDHPSLVKVYRFWEDNGTAYMVMPYLEGPTLRAALAELGRVPAEDELRLWVKPVLDALTVLHENQIWHQNLGPDAILLTPSGPVLLGFAATAHAIESIRHAPAAALRPGFAAIEQYGNVAGSTRGPWTDLYALAATVYAAITGSDPEPAADRLANDRVRPLALVAAGLYSPGFLAAIDAAMAIQPRQRPVDHTEFRALMGDMEAPQTVALPPRGDPMQEPFVPPPQGRHEVTVPDGPAIGAPAEAAPRPEPVVEAARALRKAPAVAAAAPVGGDRALPSWMTNDAATAARKRTLYGAAAGALALIVAAVLALPMVQRTARQAPSSASAPAAGASAREAAAPIASLAPSAAAPSPAGASAAAPPMPAPPAVPPQATNATGTAPTPAGFRSPDAASRPAARVAAATAASVAPATPAQRQARCIDILQKASLEKITTAETEYFKKECR
jgi:hypothetical protein